MVEKTRTTDHTSPWGAYALSPWQRFMVAAAYAVPANWASAERISRRLIRPIRRGEKLCYDVIIWGLRLRLTDRGNRSEWRLLFAPQLFDIEERRFLLQHLHSGGVFVDIGANVGAYTYWANRCMMGKGEIIAFEPDPEMRARLRFNVESNRMGGVKIEAVALSDHAGSAVLYVDREQRGRNTLESSMVDGNEIQAEQVALDTLYARLKVLGVTHIDALKIDIEGHEVPVMRHFFDHAPPTLWPRVLLAEVAHDSDGVLGEILASCGYRCVMRSDLNRGYLLDVS